MRASVYRVDELEDEQRHQMLGLMQDHFQNVTREQFARDLAEKDWAFLLTEVGSGRVHGFSTLLRFSLDVEGTPTVSFFSGDTIVRREYWHETALAQAWARHVFHLTADIEGYDAYWFLIASGFRTYRFLPVFFRAFFPTCERPTPGWAKRLLDAFGEHKFPDEYDSSLGVVRPRNPAPLRDGLGNPTARRLADRHVDFFAARNPNHAQGDELVCLAELRPENLTRAGRRMLYGPE